MGKCFYCKYETTRKWYNCFDIYNIHMCLCCDDMRCRLCQELYISDYTCYNNYCQKYDYPINLNTGRCKRCGILVMDGWARLILHHCTIPIKNKYMNVNVL